MIAKLADFGARTAFVAGTGLALKARAEISVPFEAIDGLTKPTTLTHAGTLEGIRLGGAPLIQVCGRLHPYETGHMAAMGPIYEALAAVGVERVVISGGVGSLHPDFKPGQLVQVCDHLFFGGGSPLTGRANAFLDMGQAYSALPDLAEAVYAWTHGPHLETAAEVRALQALGGQVVGMSLPPEAILARHGGLRVFGLAAVVNWATGLGPALDLDAVLAQSARVAQAIPAVLEHVVALR